MQPSMAGGGGTAPPPVVPVDVPRPVAAPQVTTLLVTESVPVPANGTAAIIGGELVFRHMYSRFGITLLLLLIQH